MSVLDRIRRLFAPPAPAPPAPPPTAAGLLDEINDARRAHLLPWTKFRHGPGAGEGFAECIDRGYPTAAACVAAWLADGDHRAIVLGRDDGCGCGVARGRDGYVYVFRAR